MALSEVGRIRVKSSCRLLGELRGDDHHIKCAEYRHGALDAENTLRWCLSTANQESTRYSPQAQMLLKGILRRVKAYLAEAPKSS